MSFNTLNLIFFFSLHNSNLWLHNSNIYKLKIDSNYNLSVKSRKELLKEVSKLASLLTTEEKKAIFMERGLPISIFGGKPSGLEAIVIYLKEVEKKTIKEIAKILNRKLSTIYTTYQQGKKKGKLNLSGEIRIPWEIFSARKHSVLEILVNFLKHEKKLSLTEISEKLNRSYSTIKTVNRRYYLKHA